MLHLICYSLLLLANLLPGPEMEFNIGWVVISLVGLIFFVNLSVIMSVNIKAALWSLHLRKLKRGHEKRLLEKAHQKLQI